MAHKTKDASIQMRTFPDRKLRLEEAAGILGQDLSSFVLSTALQRAEEVIATHGRVVLNNKERDRFLHALDAFETPDTFDKAVDHYKRVVEI